MATWNDPLTDADLPVIAAWNVEMKKVINVETWGSDAEKSDLITGLEAVTALVVTTLTPEVPEGD